MLAESVIKAGNLLQVGFNFNNRDHFPRNVKDGFITSAYQKYCPVGPVPCQQSTAVSFSDIGGSTDNEHFIKAQRPLSKEEMHNVFPELL